MLAIETNALSRIYKIKKTRNQLAFADPQPDFWLCQLHQHRSLSGWLGVDHQKQPLGAWAILCEPVFLCVRCSFPAFGDLWLGAMAGISLPGRFLAGIDPPGTRPWHRAQLPDV